MFGVPLHCHLREWLRRAGRLTWSLIRSRLHIIYYYGIKLFPRPFGEMNYLLYLWGMKKFLKAILLGYLIMWLFDKLFGNNNKY